MVIEAKYKTIADKGLVFDMRKTGAPMREIAEKVGISKERVRQILSRKGGSTRHAWLSTLQLCAMTKLPRNRVLELYEKGIIAPASTWSAGKRHYLLWAPELVQTISDYYSAHHLCGVCYKPLPKNRILFCSDRCRLERHKYKYMTPEEKARVLDNIRRYRERKIQEARVLIESVLSAPVTV